MASLDRRGSISCGGKLMLQHLSIVSLLYLTVINCLNPSHSLFKLIIIKYKLSCLAEMRKENLNFCCTISNQVLFSIRKRLWSYMHVCKVNLMALHLENSFQAVPLKP